MKLLWLRIIPILANKPIIYNAKKWVLKLGKVNVVDFHDFF